jgi:hypothetical protein
VIVSYYESSHIILINEALLGDGREIPQKSMQMSKRGGVNLIRGEGVLSVSYQLSNIQNILQSPVTIYEGSSRISIVD